MATAFETPDQAGPAAPSRVIHVLLAQTEQRLVATLDRYGEDLTAVRAELAAVLAMLDRSHFTYLCYTPEMPAEARDRAYARGQQRFAAWRSAVARILKASGRPVPWPLADPEAVDGQAPSGSHRAAQAVPRPAHHRDRVGSDSKKRQALSFLPRALRSRLRGAARPLASGRPAQPH